MDFFPPSNLFKFMIWCTVFQIIFFFPPRQSGLIPYALIHYSRGRVFQLTHILPFSIPLFYMTQPFCISPSLPNENVICNQPYFFYFRSQSSDNSCRCQSAAALWFEFTLIPGLYTLKAMAKTWLFRGSRFIVCCF